MKRSQANGWFGRSTWAGLTLSLLAVGTVHGQTGSIVQDISFDPAAFGTGSYRAEERALLAPNMFGPVLGTRWFNVNGIGGASGSRTLSAILRDRVPSNASFASNGTTTLTVLSSDLNFLGTVLSLSNYTATTNVSSQPTVPVLEIAAHTAAIQAGLAKPGEKAVFNSASLAISEGDDFYNIFLVYDFTAGSGLLFVPNPADGGLAGRNRVSTDSNPLPRDRFIFNYDLVSNAALYPTTPTMNRFNFGFEKTFLDGRASVEFRVPLASTVNSTSNTDGSFGSGHCEFGNLFLVPKMVLSANNNRITSAGLGISMPTADDVLLQLGGADLLKIRNEAVLLTPFIATLWTPTDRLFAQSWFGLGFDTGGNPALVDLTGTGLKHVGRLYDPTTLQFDMQLGYWLIHPADGNARVRGLASFFEMHLNHQMQVQNSVSEGGFTITPSVGQLSELNMSTGWVAQLGDNTNFMLGFSFPLTDARNRFSDWQLGIRVNYFFGPTGQARASLFN